MGFGKVYFTVINQVSAMFFINVLDFLTQHSG